MACGGDERSLRSAYREAHRVTNGFLFSHLVISNQSGEDGKAGSVRGRPSERPVLVRAEIKCRSRPSLPLYPLWKRPEELVQLPIIPVDRYHVPIAIILRAPFNWAVQGN